MKNRTKLLGAISASALVGSMMLLPASADHHTSDIHVVHGIPDTPVDVCIDGTVALEDFDPNTRTDAVPLAPASYDIALTAPDGDCATPIYAETVDVPAAGLDIDVVAFLDTDSNPDLAAFVNDTSPVAAGSARVTVRHTADAIPVDVLVDDAVVFANVPNGAGGDADVPAGAYNVKVTAAGDPGTVAIEADLTFDAATHYFVYAVGVLGEPSFGPYVFTTDVPEVATDRIGGQNRFETAAMIAMQAFPDGADTVYLARADLFPDSLTAAPLTVNGPILLTTSCGELFPATADAIATLGPSTIVALGGTAAVCDDILDQAAAIG